MHKQELSPTKNLTLLVSSHSLLGNNKYRNKN